MKAWNCRIDSSMSPSAAITKSFALPSLTVCCFPTKGSRRAKVACAEYSCAFRTGLLRNDLPRTSHDKTRQLRLFPRFTTRSWHHGAELLAPDVVWQIDR